MVYVLDCSYCAALFLPDERSAMAARKIETITENDEIHIPQLWWYEMSNVLTVAVRRNRIKPRDVADIIGLFAEYGFLTDAACGERYAERLFELARMYELSAYDAAYLELAIRLKAVLGSIDDKLLRAAKKAGLASLFV